MPEIEVYERPDAEEILELQICSYENRGKKPKTSFGAIEFDDDGFAEIACKGKNLKKLHSFGWLLPEDVKLFGFSASVAGKGDKVEPLPEAIAETEALHLQAKVTALQKEHTEALARVARLQSRLEEAENEALGLAEENAGLSTKCDNLTTSLAQAKKKQRSST